MKKNCLSCIKKWIFLRDSKIVTKEQTVWELFFQLFWPMSCILTIFDQWAALKVLRGLTSYKFLSQVHVVYRIKHQLNEFVWFYTKILLWPHSDSLSWVWISNCSMLPFRRGGDFSSVKSHIIGFVYVRVKRLPCTVCTCRKRSYTVLNFL